VFWRRRDPTYVPLRDDTADGAHVELVGTAEAMPGAELFGSVLGDVPCIVAFVAIPIRYSRKPLVRAHVQPFSVGNENLSAIVDVAHLRLDMDWVTHGGTSEKIIPAGSRVHVRGVLLREGGRPDDGAAFRESGVTFRIVGSKREPVSVRTVNP
jgi:hypothetical protein